VVQGQLRRLLERATKSAIDEEDLGKAMQAAEIALTIQKVVALYGSVAVEVYAEEESLHKPLDLPNVPSVRTVRFEAVAGLTEADWQRYRREAGAFGEEAERLLRALKDCLGQSGVPTLVDLGDIADEVVKWHVTWTFQASPNHAYVNVKRSTFNFPGQRKHTLTRRDAHSGHAFLAVDVKPEREENHPGRLERAEAEACAELDFSQPPSFWTFVRGAKGGLGLAASLVELTAGWLQALVGPSACDATEITYHVPACPGAASFRRLAQKAMPAVCQISGTFSVTSTSRTPPSTGTVRGEATFVGTEEAPGKLIVFKLLRGSVTAQARGGVPCTLEWGPVARPRRHAEERVTNVQVEHAVGVSGGRDSASRSGSPSGPPAATAVGSWPGRPGEIPRTRPDRDRGHPAEGVAPVRCFRYAPRVRDRSSRAPKPTGADFVREIECY
jgi:hypothetical protein